MTSSVGDSQFQLRTAQSNNDFECRW